MMININFRNKPGYAAIMSVIVLTIVIVSAALSISVAGITDIQVSSTYRNSIQERLWLESCIEEAMLKISEEDTLLTTITLPDASCTTTTNSGSPNWDFDVTLTQNGFSKTINVTAVKGTDKVNITGWEEL